VGCPIVARGSAIRSTAGYNGGTAGAGFGKMGSYDLPQIRETEP